MILILWYVVTKPWYVVIHQVKKCSFENALAAESGNCQHKKIA